MSYVKAESILPPELLEELQKYVQGKTIYIPKDKSDYQKWGTHSGSRRRLDQRNRIIKEKFKLGINIDEISEEYFLSAETIKNIVYQRN
ncbi:CD3324 family protein [Thalassobacillus devorans]|uniref:CD3324 family protein n=1 Tax=Thalassobacillus devorans TaxID=279813 RepID=UPI000A1CC8D6|nr:CD3324 family protein [Thalassobacillus devorans]